MQYRFVVELHHAAEHGQDAYQHVALDATFEEGDYSHTMLLLANMVRGLQSMYAGDVITMAVGATEVGVWAVEYHGRVQRMDDDLHRIANEIERRA